MSAEDIIKLASNYGTGIALALAFAWFAREILKRFDEQQTRHASERKEQDDRHREERKEIQASNERSADKIAAAQERGADRIATAVADALRSSRHP